MNVLAVGGSGSGKSAYAERLCASLSANRTYVATMRSDSREASERIRRHRAQRADLGFTTFECSTTLTPITSAGAHRAGVVLLDDVGNLCANALFDATGTMADPNAVLQCLYCEIVQLCGSFDHSVVVGNLVGHEGAPPHDTTYAWVRLVGSLCCMLAHRFDAVAEVSCGIATYVKGRPL